VRALWNCFGGLDSGRRSPESLLEERYARGEIDEEQLPRKLLEPHG
jgi:uncharacterized membrane protein